MKEEILPISTAFEKLKKLIMRGMPKNAAENWNILFTEKIAAVKNLEDAWPHFGLWLLSDPEYGAIKFVKTDITKRALSECISYYESWVNGSNPSRIDLEYLSNRAYRIAAIMPDKYVMGAVAYAAGAAKEALNKNIEKYAKDAEYTAGYIAELNTLNTEPQARKLIEILEK